MNDAIWKLIEESLATARRHLEMADALFDRKGMDGDAAEAHYPKMTFFDGQTITPLSETDT